VSEFTLRIELGNAEMQDGADVADALEDVARRLRAGLEGHVAVVDVNGNRVGEWMLPPGLPVELEQA
jgi:hypothetical protein